MTSVGRYCCYGEKDDLILGRKISGISGFLVGVGVDLSPAAVYVVPSGSGLCRVCASE